MKRKRPLFFAALLISLSISAQNTEVFSTDGIAIRGYDAVGYFSEGKPVKGNPVFSYEWKNSAWLFSSQKNLDSFKANPEQYAPQFGGFCAFGCSQGEGHKSPTSADAWTIVDGKLYLNYNTKVKEYWSKDIPGNIEKAKRNWPALKDQE